MKYFLFIYMFITILFGCAVNKKMSDREVKILEKALSLKEPAAIAEATIMLDTRIKKYDLKNDRALQVQLLIAAKEYDAALKASENIINHFPEYIEMIVLHCVLSKYILPANEAKNIYQQSVNKLQIILQDRTTTQQQYNTLSNLLLLHCLFEDHPNKQACRKKITALEISNEEKDIIEQISQYTESELFALCNIY